MGPLSWLYEAALRRLILGGDMIILECEVRLRSRVGGMVADKVWSLYDQKETLGGGDGQRNANPSDTGRNKAVQPSDVMALRLLSSAPSRADGDQNVRVIDGWEDVGLIYRSQLKRPGVSIQFLRTRKTKGKIMLETPSQGWCLGCLRIPITDQSEGCDLGRRGIVDKAGTDSICGR